MVSLPVIFELSGRRLCAAEPARWKGKVVSIVLSELSNDELSALSAGAARELNERLTAKIADHPQPQVPVTIAGLIPWEPVPESILRAEQDHKPGVGRVGALFQEEEDELAAERRRRVVIDGVSVSWLSAAS